MKLVKFNLKEYNTGNYELVTAEGKKVKLGPIDETERAAILGWVNGFACIWDIDGVYLTTKGMGKFDLKLKPKSQTVYISVTRNQDGKINAYASVEGEPKVMSKSTLLKRITLEV
jgi:hypothetical protein